MKFSLKFVNKFKKIFKLMNYWIAFSLFTNMLSGEYITWHWMMEFISKMWDNQSFINIFSILTRSTYIRWWLKYLKSSAINISDVMSSRDEKKHIVSLFKIIKLTIISHRIANCLFSPHKLVNVFQLYP